MKYISINSVVDAFNGCKGKTLNKFWGLIAILKVIDQKIIPAKPYVFKTSEVSNWLEEVFRFEDNPKRYNTSAVWTVIFSSHWTDYVPEQMFAPKSKPNVYDVATWFFRTKTFDDDITSEKVISEFIDSLHLNKEEIDEWFSFEKKEIVFTETAYRDSEILLQFDNSFPESLTISFETPTFIKSRPGSLGQAPFVQTLYANQMTQKCLILTQLDFNDFYPFNSNNLDVQMNNNQPLQQIFYGAPGTGKSFEINRITKNKQVIRTTFHPDSDYSTFVGAYKPTSIEIPVRDVTGKVIVENGKQVTENRIVYEFVEQAFLQAYIKAWSAYAEATEGEKAEEQYLVIEEINRGNCAQIFGDLFQLLDRNGYGFSEYPISADKDMKKQLAKAFKGMVISDAERINEIYGKDIVDEVLSGEILLLPDNLFIWATMNTSDQSLFPIDSAFKRRWDWKYIPICEGKENGVSLGWKIKINGKLFDWWQFVEKINAEINELTKSEDKKLGYFFCKAQDGIVTAETFVSKVIFYLWNDVFKDMAFGSDIFMDGENELTFNSFYAMSSNEKAVVKEDKVEVFLQNLGVKYDLETVNGDDNKQDLEEEATDETVKIQRRETIISIQLPGNPLILSSDSTQFDAFVKALRIIGIEKIKSISSTLKYKRLGYPVISTQKYDGIVNNDKGYSYYQEGDLYIVKGCKSYTYIRILEDIDKLLNIGLSVETK